VTAIEARGRAGDEPFAAEVVNGRDFDGCPPALDNVALSIARTPLALVHNRPREVALRRVAELASVVHIKTKKSHRFCIFHQQLTNDPNPTVGTLLYGLLILFKNCSEAFDVDSCDLWTFCFQDKPPPWVVGNLRKPSSSASVSAEDTPQLSERAIGTIPTASRYPAGLQDKMKIQPVLAKRPECTSTKPELAGVAIGKAQYGNSSVQTR
jgi:hypothetical protein